MNRILTLFTFLLTAHMSVASEKTYVEGDQTLNMRCEQKDTSAKPYNYFELKFYYDENAEVSLSDIMSGGDFFSSGNGDAVYKVNVVQFPFYGAEILSVTQSLKGCEFAPMTLEVKEEGKFETYFECDGDGDAGFGSIIINPETLKAEGKLTFPEGQSSLLYPLIEGAEVEVTCSMDF